MNDILYPDLAVIDGQAINIATMDDAIAAALAYARLGRGFRFFTLNLDHIVKRREDPAFRAAYESANLVSADGAPVARLARRQFARIERTTGADLVKPLARAAAQAGIPIALFGTSDAVLDKSASILVGEAPGLVIAHRESPPLGFNPTSPDAKAALQCIADSGARIVLVALGAPKQELFAAHWAAEFPQLGFVCIGAALDFIAGTQSRAPETMQKLGLEWLWRLGGNPARMARRYALCAGVLASLILNPTGPEPDTTKA